MRIKKMSRLIAFLVALIFFMMPFNNIVYAEKSHWAAKEIEYVKNKGIMVGNEKGEFAPNRKITRAEFAKVVNNLFNYTEKAEIDFPDVEKEWYYEDIQKAVKAGYMSGYPDGTMKPKETIIREEAASMIAKACGLSTNGTSTAKKFKDYDEIGSWAVKYVDAVARNGIMIGTAREVFNPNKGIERAEVAKIAYIINEKGIGENENPGKDDPGQQKPEPKPEPKPNINEVSQIKMEKVNGKDAIVIYNTKEPKYKRSEWANSGRVVVDILDSNIGDIYDKYDFNIGVIKSIRTSQFNDTVVRVVLDAKDGIKNPDAEVKIDGNKIIIYPEESSGNNTKPEEPTEPTKPIAPNKKLVVIDAGHGGGDPGAIPNIAKEKDVNLNVAKKLNKKLKALGYETIMTRSTDEYVGLLERADIANRNEATIFVSIHANSAGNSSASGIEVLYCPADQAKVLKTEGSYTLAKDICDEVIKETGARNRGVKKRPKLIVLNRTKMPAALIEVGFLSNPEEEKLITNGWYQDKLADGIAKGIQKYFANK